MIESGPEAAATRARLEDACALFQGEGATVLTGEDGGTFCVHHDEPSLLDLGDPEEVDESERRDATTVVRFATAAERDAHVAAAPWQAHARRRGWAVLDQRPRARRQGGGFELDVSAGLTASEMRLSVEDTGAGVTVRWESTFQAHEHPAPREADLPADVWARFEEELRILGASSWTRYRPQALDGLSWSMRWSTPEVIEAGGHNAYPPHGHGPDPSPEFGRLVLATERLVGHRLWPGFDMRPALKTIADERDRVEQLLLAAVRAWADATEHGGIDPAALRERGFQTALLPHLSALTTTRAERDVKGLITGWPGVGAVDVEVMAEGRPSWIELKWPKNDANELHNCLWDAAKLAQALRERTTTYGYLLAGAPASTWARRNRAVRLFGVSNHLGRSLVDDYLGWWGFWAKENARTYPLELPTPVITVPVGEVRLAAPSGVSWLVKLARVEAPGTGSYAPRRG